MIIVNTCSILRQIIPSHSLANHLEKISHDTINRYLRTESLNFLRNAAQTQDLWQNVKKEIVKNTEVYLIFDDTVIQKKYALYIELVRRQ